MIRLAAAILLVSSALAHTKEEWRSRSIYQIITDRFYRTDGLLSDCSNLGAYCGGTFQGIEAQLDYIKGMGFDAIWISPIPENYGNDYHGYAGLNWYNVNPNFGTAEELKSMVATAHSKDIWVMLDVVANHVAYIDEDYYKVTPFDSVEYYHDKCQITDFNDHDQMEYCRLSNLPDLNQDHEFVRSFLKDWVREQIETFGFDGIRVDTVPYVKYDFWHEYAESAGVFQIGEVFDGDIGWVASYQGYSLDSLVNYPLYFALKDVFNYRQSMYKIRDTLYWEDQQFEDTTVLGTFIDNHDNQRFLYVTPSEALLKSALTYTLFGLGIPIVYYGTEQEFHGGNDPYNREVLWTSMDSSAPVYQYLSLLNQVRKDYQIYNEAHVERWCDDQFYAFTRGDVLVALTNDDSGNTQYREIAYHEFSKGQELCNVVYPGDCITIGDDNLIKVTLLHGEAKVFVPSQSALQ